MNAEFTVALILQVLQDHSLLQGHAAPSHTNIWAVRECHCFPGSLGAQQHQFSMVHVVLFRLLKAWSQSCGHGYTMEHSCRRAYTDPPPSLALCVKTSAPKAANIKPAIQDIFIKSKMILFYIFPRVFFCMFLSNCPKYNPVHTPSRMSFARQWGRWGPSEQH